MVALDNRPGMDYTASMTAISHTAQSSLQQADTSAHDQRKALTLALGQLPDDLTDTEISAVVIAACGGSRAEIGGLLGYETVDSVTRWRRLRADVIRQAEDNIQVLLSGIARLAMTNVLMTGLELSRKALRHAQTVSQDDAGDALVKLARAGRDIVALADWITEHNESHSRSGSPPEWGMPPRSDIRAIQASSAALSDLVSGTPSGNSGDSVRNK